MWDETAFMPIVLSKHRRSSPEAGPFLFLDADSCGLPANKYMRITGYPAEALRGDRTTHDHIL